MPLDPQVAARAREGPRGRQSRVLADDAGGGARLAQPQGGHPRHQARSRCSTSKTDASPGPRADIPLRIYTPRAVGDAAAGARLAARRRPRRRQPRQLRCALPASSRWRPIASSCRSTTGSRPSTSFPPASIDSFAALTLGRAARRGVRRRSRAHRDRRRQRRRQSRRGVRDPRARRGRPAASLPAPGLSAHRARRGAAVAPRRSPKATC